MSILNWKAPASTRDWLSIGDLADATGKSVHTIRWYESQGLIPGVGRSSGGRRTYVPDHIPWLEFIDHLKATGMTVAEMRAYARLVAQGRKTLSDRLTVLKTHRDAVKKRLSETRRALRLVEAKIGYYDRWLETGERPDAIPRLVPPKKAAVDR